MYEYKSLKELYTNLKPAFDIKLKELKYQKEDNITKEDIWTYLTVTKWKNATNLGIADMVSDIMHVNYIDIKKYKKENSLNNIK